MIAAESAARVLPGWWWLAPLAGVLALVMAYYFYASIMRASPGNARMQEIAGYVREGAYAYLRRQYKVVGLVFLGLLVLLSIMSFVLGVQHRLVPFAFLTGGLFSGLAGFIGMKTATAASARTAQGASESLNRGLTIAFRAGAVMGLTVVGLALIDITAWFVYLYKYHHVVFGGHPMNLETITVVMLCFGMGASTQALFARVGGGIYTKAADVGADLVGKVEAGIPEDDPRNPATIADNVGDNVGDVAGMGADLYESYAGSILATAALGVAAATVGNWGIGQTFAYLATPMMLAALGIVLSIFGIFLVRTREDASMKVLLAALNRGIYVSSLLIVIGSYFLIRALEMPMGVFWSILVGVVLGIVIGKGTEWATASDFKPTRFIADQAQTGPATVIIGGIAEGLLSTWIPVLAVCVGTLLAFAVMGGFVDLLAGLYGVGIAAVGMLSTLGLTLATDAYGPIADNAGGNAEMSYLPKEVRHRTDALDSLGNTTAAIGKGFAIGSAALTALALLASYIEEVRIGIHREAAAAYEAPADGAPYVLKAVGGGKYGLYFAGSDGDRDSDQFHTLSAFAGTGRNAVVVPAPDGNGEISVIITEVGELIKGVEAVDRDGRRLAATKASLEDFMTFYNVTLMNPKVMVGVFLGVLMVFVFSALTMKAVGRAAYAMVQEVRRQFREKPGIMEGTEIPDYARCVAISTAGAQREMLLPSILAIAAPVLVGLFLNISGLLGLLVGGLCAGFSMAVFMANAGGAWDNAKKYIEAGHLGGKGSLAHKAAVVGDTVGDPFKDTCGPSLNILIKLMTMVSIVFAGLVVKYAPMIGAWLNLGN
ncbi:MAG TPA: sodium-translocating pyrophosphatase [Kiritimatiellia bacterium]|nr:sodium-translocating pyrophosphatase [Kiritimatiellia bacterium]HMP00034.1 sodium-translocating pyrophosphatase [Kiritimatiellia bacterium]HMP97521.1 sodium-translocating pyrophosphatase [Kiritimatiellia bacterium]